MITTVKHTVFIIQNLSTSLLVVKSSLMNLSSLLPTPQPSHSPTLLRLLPLVVPLYILLVILDPIQVILKMMFQISLLNYTSSSVVSSFSESSHPDTDDQDYEDEPVPSSDSSAPLETASPDLSRVPHTAPLSSSPINSDLVPTSQAVTSMDPWSDIPAIRSSSTPASLLIASTPSSLQLESSDTSIRLPSSVAVVPHSTSASTDLTSLSHSPSSDSGSSNSETHDLVLADAVLVSVTR